jgi:hypothetical protein
MFRKYSERLAEFEMLTNRLLLSFRSNDDDEIITNILSLAETKLSFNFISSDLLFHYFNSCGHKKAPDFIVFAQLIQRGVKITPEARGLFRKLYLEGKDSSDINDDILQISRIIIK